MREFGTLRLACVSSARALLAALEMLLLLLWRHVAHYAGAPGAGNGPPARGAVVSALRLLGGGADPAAFRHCIAAMHAAPADFLFVDDRAENVRAAQATGMKGHVFTGHEELAAAVDTWLPTP